jgi:hypothetical protein
MTVGKINVSEEGFTTVGTSETKPTAIIWPSGWWQLFRFYRFSKVALRITRGFGLSVILVSPSLHEGYGFPVAEALQRGIPVLAKAIPTYMELFSSHVV